MSIFNQLLGGLAGGATGLAQQRENTFQKQRLAQSDARTARADQFALDDRAKATDAERTLGQYLKPALMGDQDAQAQVIRVAPHLADRFVKPPTPDEIQYDATRGGRVNVSKNTFEPTPGVTPTAKAPLEGSPEWRENLKTKALVDKEYGYHAPSGADATAENRHQNLIKGVRDQFNGDQMFKDAQQVQGALAKIKAAATGDHTTTNDMSLIFGIQKLQDPTSSVREGEYATAANAANWPARVRDMYNLTLKNHLLPDETRQQFLQSAQQIAKAQRSAFGSTMKRYSAIATRQGIDPRDVVSDPYEGLFDEPPAPSGPPNPPPQSGNIDLRAQYPGGKPSLEQRVEQLRQQGMDKNTARRQLLKEGYVLK